MPFLKMVIFCLASSICMKASARSGQWVTTYIVMVTFPNATSQSAGAVIDKWNEVAGQITDAAEGQGLRCIWSDDGPGVSKQGNDVIASGVLQCPESSSKQFDGWKVEEDLEAQTGLKILILAPPGGGATIHN